MAARRHRLIERPIMARDSEGMTNDMNVSNNNFDYKGFVANTEREVPTGPDPLHNREDQA